MEQSYLRNFENLCTQEEAPACQTMCPLHVETRPFLAFMAEGKEQDARKILERTMPLSGLTGYLCTGNCLKHCQRAGIDNSVNLPLVERACLQVTSASKPFPLPGSGKQIAVLGSALSSLCAAYELAKKGHAVSLFYYGIFGGPLAAIEPDLLPITALKESCDQLLAFRVNMVKLDQPITSEQFIKTIADFQATFMGFDDPLSFTADMEFFEQYAAINSLTLETGWQSIFTCTNEKSYIAMAAEGKRAAGSIDRFLQGVAPTAAREKDAVYPSSLYTNLNDVAVLPSAAKNFFHPSPQEAREEAKRCIQCECLECVKNCPYLQNFKGYPKKYAREMYNNLSVITGIRKANLSINSCAECGLCAKICPSKADMGSFCASARREMVKSSRMPPSAHEFALEDMQWCSSSDVAFFRRQSGKSTTRWLFFPGCRLPAVLPAETEQVYRHLTENLDGGVAFMYACCGAPARWSGRDILTADMAAKLDDNWQASGKPTFITACASCLLFMKKELPHIPCVSLWDILADLPLPALAGNTDFCLALHDPCSARDEKNTCSAARAILKSLEQDIEELPFREAKTRCCGFGGLASDANPALGRRFAEERAKESENPLLCWCIMCREKFAQAGKPAMHLLELLFSPADSAKAIHRPATSISQRQPMILKFKEQLLKNVFGEKLPEQDPVEFCVSYAPGLEKTLEERRIRLADIESVLKYIRQNGSQFYSTKTKRYKSSFRPRQVTFWLEYELESPDSYRIHDAYCHRMIVPGVPGAGAQSPCTLEGYSSKGSRV